MMVTNAWSGQTRLNHICRWIAVCAMVIGTAAALVSQTAERPDRITQPLTSGGVVTIAGSVHPLTRRATDLGAVNSAMPMNEMTMNVSLSAAQKSERDALLAAQQDPNSPQYHQWLTQEEYGARFGLTDADLSQLTGWLESQGFTVNGVSKSRNAIYFSGQAWQVESAFHTQLHKFQLNGETHLANATELQVPAGLAGVMLNLRGLNNFRPRPHLHKLSAPAYTANTSDGLFNYLAPADWATIYNLNPVYTAGFTGTGYYVGVVGQTYAPESDITNFRNASGLGAVNLIYDCIDPKVANCTGSYAIAPDSAGDLGEADLDIEWSGGIAKNATVVFVYAPYSDACSNASCSTGVIDPVTNEFYGAFDALQRAVQDYTIPASAPAPMANKVLPVIGMSYGDCEASFSGDSSYQTWVQDIGVQANSQGQTIVVSSGDSGAAECDTQGEPTSDYPAYLGEFVDVPADSPNYTGVGGTTLSGDESDPTAYWNQSAPDLNVPGNAIQYIPEVVWNDTSSANGLLASGGGVSQYFGLPTWQAGLISGQTFRLVPDIAFAASPNNDGYLVCSQSDTTTTYGTDCANDSFWSSNGYIGQNVYGGTSASTQAFAGLLTLLVQAQGTGKGLGNINPTLYGLATTTPAVFNQQTYLSNITPGNNIVPCVPAQPNAPDPGCVTSGTTGTMGYTAQTGYDLATGLGSINGGALYAALFPSAGLAATTTTVTQPNPVALNGSTSLTATVTSTTPGTITGTVTFTLGGTQLGAPATISGGSATLPDVAVTAANGFAVGPNTILATYSGNTSYAGSSGSAQLTVTSAPAAATTTTMTQPNPVALNGSTSLTATVTSTTPGTITGTVTFTLGSRNLGSGSLSGGTATLPSVAVTAANGFVVGPNTILATYSGNTSYAGSSGSAQLTVTSTSVAATTTALVQPNPVALNGSTSLTATVTSTTPGTITGTVTFTLGSRNLGSGSVSGGSATLPNVAVTTANGFALGANTIVATYGGNTSYAGSNGTGQLIVPGYTLSASVNSVSLTPSGVFNVGLTLISSDYAGTVTLTPTVTSTNGTASNVTATLTNSQYTLASGQTITPMLTLTASASAANHRPLLPWQSGGVVAFGVLLLGAPFTLRNRRALAVLLIAAAIVLLGFSMACSSGGGNGTVPARVYTVTVTPSGSGVVTNPAPVTITVRVD